MATDLEMALARLAERNAVYHPYADYYQGKHSLQFATEKFRNTFGSLFRAFSSNLCPPVVDAVADRLELTGFGVEGADLPMRAALRRQEEEAVRAGRPVEREQDAGDAAWSVWQENRMDLRAGAVHREALKCGDAFVLVWPDPETERPTLFPQRTDLVTVVYDEERPGKVLWAAKVWLTREKKARVNLYYSDRIEKYVTRTTYESIPTKQAQYEEFRVEGEPWPLENPWDTVPVFHFANNAGIGEFGESELRHVTPLQDALNKSILDMMVAMEFVAYPQRWATGIEFGDTPEDQQVAKFKAAVDRIWSSDNKDTKFGQFEQANLEGFLKVQDGFRMDIARVTGTPLHYMMLLSGTPPSGEALKTLEARLVKRVTARQVAFGNIWEDALALALRMTGQAEPPRLAAEWADPAPKSEKEMTESFAALTNAGASLYTAARIAGYDEAQAEELQRGDVVTGIEQ